jgi:hypothetical protein
MPRIIAAALLALLAATPAQAQGQGGNTCRGRVLIANVTQASGPGNTVFYAVTLLNGTQDRVTLDVGFSGFPGAVTVYSPTLTNVPLEPRGGTREHRFGRGTLGLLDTAAVARVYDSQAGGGPTVRIGNCRLG